MMDKINELLNEATKIDKEVNGEKETEKRERELMEEEKRYYADIKMPVYYWCEDKDGNATDDFGVSAVKRNYDFEEMADELENRIFEKLGKKVLITISEVGEGNNEEK